MGDNLVNAVRELDSPDVRSYDSRMRMTLFYHKGEMKACQERSNAYLDGHGENQSHSEHAERAEETRNEVFCFVGQAFREFFGGTTDKNLVRPLLNTLSCRLHVVFCVLVAGPLRRVSPSTL